MNADVIRILDGVAPGSILFVSYIPGRKPTPRAVQEARRAIEDEGIAPRHFTGRLERVWVTKKGETVFTVWVEERDSMQDGTLKPGAFRCFNASLGHLLTLEVLERATA